MALVKCPECGRENVSNTASMCPGCGYDLKSHFSIELQENSPAHAPVSDHTESIKNEAIIQPENAAPSLSDEEANKKRIQYLESKIQASKKESIISGSIAGVALCFFIAVALTGGNVWLGFVCFWTAVLSGIAFYSSYSDFATCKKDIHLINTNIEEYNKVREQRIEEAKKALTALAKRQELNHPKCPHCGSNNTQRISTMNRATSVATVGLASSKIGKQYECKNCKHKW